MPTPAPQADGPSAETAATAPGSPTGARAAVNGNGGNGHAGNGHAGNGASPSHLRRAILVHLRQAGPTSPDGLAAALGASRTGVLQQLHALEQASLVQHAPHRHGVGRPRHLYDVTPDAQELFPADYEGLAVGLLTAIEEIGGADLVEQVFAARRRQIMSRLQHALDENLPEGASLPARVTELARIQDRGGYLAEAVLADDAVLLRQHNCAIHRLASKVPAACDAELALFREVLGADVVRQTHIAAGDRCCTYRIGGTAES
jgi:predicted ArsR family transcriptional regulator